MDAAVRVQSLSFRYGPVTAVADVSFAVAAGEVFGLLGPNGAGKTTTLECMLGLRKPASGSVTVGGFNVATDLKSVRQILGAQLQTTQLQDQLTPRQAVRFFRSFYKSGPTVDWLIGRFELTQFADQAFGRLAGGQRQRVGLALAFVNEPSVLVLDEPTAALDPLNRRGLHDLIRSLRAEGRSVILSTHLIDEAAALCDRVGVIAAGRLVRVGTPAELIKTSTEKPAILIRTDRTMTAPDWEGLIVEPFQGGWRIEATDLTATLGEVIRRVRGDVDGRLTDVQVVKPTLEQAVIDLSTAATADAAGAR